MLLLEFVLVLTLLLVLPLEFVLELTLLLVPDINNQDTQIKSEF